MLCFVFPHWFSVRFHMSWGGGVHCPIYIFHAQVCVKYFGVIFEHLILSVLVFPFFIPSDSFGFCLHFLLHCNVICAISLAFVTLCFWKIFLFFPVGFSVFRAWSHFSKYFYFFSLVAFLPLHSYWSRNFCFFCFCFLLLGSFIVPVMIVGTAHIRLFISVIFFQKFFISVYSIFWFYQFTVFLFGNLWLLDVSSTYALCHIFWMSSFIFSINMYCSSSVSECMLAMLPKPVLLVSSFSPFRCCVYQLWPLLFHPSLPLVWCSASLHVWSWVFCSLYSSSVVVILFCYWNVLFLV